MTISHKYGVISFIHYEFICIFNVDCFVLFVEHALVGDMMNVEGLTIMEDGEEVSPKFDIFGP